MLNEPFNKKVGNYYYQLMNEELEPEISTFVNFSNNEKSDMPLLIFGLFEQIRISDYVLDNQIQIRNIRISQIINEIRTNKIFLGQN